MTRVLTDSGLGVQSQPTYPLDDDGLLTIQPDLVFVRRGAAVGVADVRYKRLDKPGAVTNPDVYQLVTYCRRVGLDTGHLFYAALHPSFPLRLSRVGVTLRVHGVDLSAPVDVIEARSSAPWLRPREAPDRPDTALLRWVVVGRRRMANVLRPERWRSARWA